IGTTSVNISRWERGATSPSPYFRQQLCTLFNTNAQELGFLPTEKPAPPELNEQVVYLSSHVEPVLYGEEGGSGHYPSLVETGTAQCMLPTDSVPPKPLYASVSRNQNRLHMLRRLRYSYSDLMNRSLQGTAWLDLGLTMVPNAVQNAASLLLRARG